MPDNQGMYQSKDGSMPNNRERHKNRDVYRTKAPSTQTGLRVCRPPSMAAAIGLQLRFKLFPTYLVHTQEHTVDYDSTEKKKPP